MTTTQVTSTKLQTGVLAPSLEVETVDGDVWKLADQHPQNYTMILFYRGLHCPICKQQLGELEQRLEKFRKLGVETIAISGDNQDCAQTSKQEWNVAQVPIGYGLSIESMRQWGLYISKGASEKEPPLFNEPALFLIKPDCTVAYAVINSGPFGRPHLSDIASGIDFILKNQYPLRGTEA
ncbi:MAG: redoxin domain-containing protein [Rivularia sp. (in: cyanobacteria)]